MSAAQTIIDANAYMTLATADADGTPWASPVWFAHAGYREFVWLSKPDARHSRNLAARPHAGVVIFDSTVTPNEGTAVYFDAVVDMPADPEAALAVYAERSRREGLRAWTLADITAPAPHRLYRAVAADIYVLDEHDRRVVDLPA